ncbi:MAG: glycosyltransferase [Acidobacteriia bacterium]|nr:glycosyltransferase [Terriglobia bacterium]
MPTARGFTKRAFQCGLYEAQDVLVENDAVDLIALEPGPGFRFRESWQRRLLYRDISRRLIYVNPGLRRVRLTGEYDLFVAVCQNYWDLLYLNAIEGWEDQCKTSVCWIDEMWAAEIPLFKYWLHSLRRFDHVFVGISSSVVPLSNAIGKPCRWLPGAVDCLRFTPYPEPPERVVDVYSIGRRWEGIHQALLQAAKQRDIFYVHDTFPAAYAEPYDHRQHREMMANMAKRSRCYMVAPPKMDAPEETNHQSAIGYRYYDGAAAGAVMIGQAPHCEVFNTMFPWPDVVIPIRPDGSDVVEVLARLGSEPERVSAISGRNAAEALRRHDWLYRWKEIFQIAGLEPSAGMMARERRLKDLAELATSEMSSRTLS